MPLNHTLTGDHTCNLGMCPDWDRNRSLLVYGMMFQPTEPYQPGPLSSFERPKILCPELHSQMFHILSSPPIQAGVMPTSVRLLVVGRLVTVSPDCTHQCARVAQTRWFHKKPVQYQGEGRDAVPLVPRVNVERTKGIYSFTQLP